MKSFKRFSVIPTLMAAATVAMASFFTVVGVCSADSQVYADPASANPSRFIKTSINTSSRQRNMKLMADHILVEKNKRKLTLFADGEVLKSYKISLGREPAGDKIRSGDNRTPEGFYYIDYRVQESDFHMALHISYPNGYDKFRARELGTDPGGNIMLHGLKNNDRNIAYYHGYFDWTKGCIAVTNAEIEEIWEMVPNGTSIEIRP